VSAPRLAAIAFEHIEAELAVFPFASEASFHLGTSALDPIVSQNDVLWRAAEREIIGALPSLPLDEASSIRDKLWFGSPVSSDPAANERSVLKEPVSLVSYLRRLANTYIDSQGRPIDVSGSEASSDGGFGPEGRLRWAWMCQAFPADLLRTARSVVDPAANPLVLSPSIETMLRDKGFAETHQHLGASLDFSLAWAALMSSLARNESKASDFESPGASFDDGKNLCTWILYAAVARLVLAEWLNRGLPSTSSLDALLRFSKEDSTLRVALRDGVKPQSPRLDIVSSLDVVERHRLISILSDLRSGKWQDQKQPNFGEGSDLDNRFAQARSIYHRLIRPQSFLGHSHDYGGTSEVEKGRYKVFGQDPVAAVLDWRPSEGNSPETLFVEAALSRIEHDERNGEKEDKETDFSRLFWQVVRVRCLLYRHIVQRPMTPGLQWFVRFFSRIKPLRKNVSGEVLARTAAIITGEGAGLRSLELRLGTDPNESACVKLVKDLEAVARPRQEKPKFKFFRPKQNDDKVDRHCEDEQLEVGGVFHFSRKRGGGWVTGRPNAFGLDHSFPGRPSSVGKKPPKDAGNSTGFRFASFYMEQRQHAQALVSLFQKYPLALRTIRGVDLCTDEAGIPVWVMAPLVRWVREAGQIAASHLKRQFDKTPPPLRTSVHAGEDFVHLLSGLRRIDNTITFLDLQEGDRLGHALALGIDASAWCTNAGRVVQTREERLLDLVWEWSCYAKYDVEVAPKRLAYVSSEIPRLAGHIFKDAGHLSDKPDDLVSWWAGLHQQTELRESGFPDKPGVSNLAIKNEFQTDPSDDTPQVQRLMRAYLRDEHVWRNGRVLETIDLRNLKHEAPALNALQTALQRKIGELCLTIEVNPSSNLLIGDLIDFKNHPLWRMKPVDTSGNSSPLSICIGTDNPITFATTLPHEYQLLFDAIVLGEKTHEVAVKWIDEVREAGMRTRFTLASDVTKLSQDLRPTNLQSIERPLSPP
jgi:hypothetical protein